MSRPAYKFALPVWSATQAKLYARCPRRWAFERIGKFDEGPTEKMILGTAYHSEMERWLKTGQPVDSIECAAQAKEFSMGEYDDLIVEAPVVVEWGGVTWIGYIDTVLLDADYNNVRIGDWKFTSSWSNMLKPAELNADLAACIYAMAAFQGGAESVTARWSYVLWGGRKVRTTETKMHLETCAHVLDEASAAALQGNQYRIDLTSGAMSYDDVPYDTADCFMYRRPCPNKGVRCFPEKEKFKLVSTLEYSNFEAEIESIVAKRPAPPALKKAAPPPPPPLLTYKGKPVVGAASGAGVEICKRPPPPPLKPKSPFPADTAIGVPERGFVNPASGPAVAQPTPEDEFVAQGGNDVEEHPIEIPSDGLENMDLADLKALAKAEGADHLPKARKPGVITAIRANRMARAAQSAVDATRQG